MNLRQIVCEVDETGSGSCQLAILGISGVEPTGSAATVLVACLVGWFGLVWLVGRLVGWLVGWMDGWMDGFRTVIFV
jgi:hypothetical protein